MANDSDVNIVKAIEHNAPDIISTLQAEISSDAVKLVKKAHDLALYIVLNEVSIANSNSKSES